MAEQLAPGTVLHNRYTIEQMLRSDSRGATYLATWTAEAATKTVVIRENVDTSAEGQAQFHDEVQALARLEHPVLPVVIDYFVEPSGQQYMVMDHVEGLDLEEALARGGAQSEAEALLWFDRLLSAVEYLHGQPSPFIHGSIGPATIVIGVDGTPHLTDLIGGDKKPEPEDALAPTSRAFMPPEQYLGKLNEPSDIYALGATLYAVLTGKMPPSAMARAAGQSLLAPRQLNPNISRHVEAAILKAMAMEGQRRYATVADFAQALERPAPVQKTSILVPILLVTGGIGIVCLVALVVSRFVLPMRSRPWPRPNPAPTKVIALAPTATATVALAPAVAPTVAATEAAAGETSVPATPMAAPEPLVMVTSTSTPRASPAAPQTAARRDLAPPSLLSPPHEASLEGSIEFRWHWNAELAANERYDLQVWREGTEPAGIAWSNEPYYRADSLPGGSGDYFWRVQVVRVANGYVVANITEPSAQRAFSWRAVGEVRETAAAPTSAPPPTAVPPTEVPVPPTDVPQPPTSYPALPSRSQAR